MQCNSPSQKNSGFRLRKGPSFVLWLHIILLSHFKWYYFRRAVVFPLQLRQTSQNFKVDWYWLFIYRSRVYCEIPHVLKPSDKVVLVNSSVLWTRHLLRRLLRRKEATSPLTQHQTSLQKAGFSWCEFKTHGKHFTFHSNFWCCYICNSS